MVLLAGIDSNPAERLGNLIAAFPGMTEFFSIPFEKGSLATRWGQAKVRPIKIRGSVISALALPLACAQGEGLSLHPLWKDGAVVQRNVPLPLTGRAQPGTTVIVEWRGRTHMRSADASGRWSVLLPAGSAESQPQTLQVRSGADSLRVTNVLVGEVWLASGQSNMEWILKECVAQASEAALATDPLLRLVTIPRAMADQPTDDVPVVWQAATPERVLNWSAEW
ncbi:MAG: hypothetical protein EBX90_14600, partial [Betaproteobacteria bacterium]|nr:hypothetical protein [Betaproteobacteria bacterium]